MAHRIFPCVFQNIRWFRFRRIGVLLIILGTQVLLVRWIVSTIHERQSCKDGYLSPRDQMILPRDQYVSEKPHLHSGVKVVNLSSPIPLKLECVRLKSKPPTPICIYSKGDLLSNIYRRGLWEADILESIQDALRKDPELGFIDIGANLGYYALIVANMGHQVVAVEPLVSNIWRLKKAAILAGTTSKLTVVQNAISDQHYVVPINIQAGNIGASSLASDKLAPCLYQACGEVQTIYLDDILPLMNFSRAIMKIDVEGFEPRVILSAEKIFDAVSIPLIHMEWIWQRNTCQGNLTREHVLVDKMFSFLKKRKYNVYNTVGGERLSRKDCSKWRGDVVWIRDWT